VSFSFYSSFEYSDTINLDKLIGFLSSNNKSSNDFNETK
jgi:hypothetical protein